MDHFFLATKRCASEFTTWYTYFNIFSTDNTSHRWYSFLYSWDGTGGQPCNRLVTCSGSPPSPNSDWVGSNSPTTPKRIQQVMDGWMDGWCTLWTLIVQHWDTSQTDAFVFNMILCSHFDVNDSLFESKYSFSSIQCDLRWHETFSDAPKQNLTQSFSFTSFPK